MARSGCETKSSDVEDLPDTSLVTTTNGDNNYQKTDDHDATAPAANHDHVNHDITITEANSNPSTLTKSTSADHSLDPVTSPGITPNTVEKEIQETTTRRRSDSVVSKVSRHLERAVRRRSGIEELRS